MARASPPLLAFIDPDDPILVAPGDHPAHIRAICKRTGQSVPQNEAGVIRCVFESLALKYRSVIERLVNLTGRTVDVIHIIGGGSQNKLLCQMTANATGRVVVAGPTEATVIGNALVQLITLGELKDLRQARDLVAQMEALQSFDPRDREAWKNAYHRFLALWGHHFVGR